MQISVLKYDEIPKKRTNMVYKYMRRNAYHSDRIDIPGRIGVCLVDSSRYHYTDVIMGTMASQITSLTIVYSIVYSGADQRKHQSPASLALVRGLHRWPVNSPHKWPVTRKIFPFDDVIMQSPLYAALSTTTISPKFRVFSENKFIFVSWFCFTNVFIFCWYSFWNILLQSW